MSSVVWTSESEKRLLMAVLHTHPPAKPQYAKVATMIGNGTQYTSEGVRQRFLKVRKESDEKWGENLDVVKRRFKGGGRRKKVKAEVEDVEGEDGEDEDWISAKITKGRGNDKGKATIKKVESDGESSDEIELAPRTSTKVGGTRKAIDGFEGDYSDGEREAARGLMSLATAAWETDDEDEV